MQAVRGVWPAEYFGSAPSVRRGESTSPPAGLVVYNRERGAAQLRCNADALQQHGITRWRELRPFHVMEFGDPQLGCCSPEVRRNATRRSATWPPGRASSTRSTSRKLAGRKVLNERASSSPSEPRLSRPSRGRGRRDGGGSDLSRHLPTRRVLRRFGRPQAYEAFVTTTISRDAAVLAGVTVLRGRGPLYDGERQRWRELIPHLRRASDVHRELNGARIIRDGAL